MNYRVYPVTATELSHDGYRVWINGEPVALNTARVSAMPFNRRWPGHQRQIDRTELVNFLSLETDMPLRFRVQPRDPFERVEIRPASLGIKPTVTADGMIAGKRCLLMKPQTMMNLSGEAILEAADYYGIPEDKIIILFDDISLDVGKTRIRRKGSTGGHNGIKSIISCLGSEAFPRVKIGVGKKPHPDYDLKDWVLSSFSAEEKKALAPALSNAAEAVKLLVQGETEKAMNLYNS